MIPVVVSLSLLLLSERARAYCSYRQRLRCSRGWCYPRRHLRRMSFYDSCDAR